MKKFTKRSNFRLRSAAPECSRQASVRSCTRLWREHCVPSPLRAGADPVRSNLEQAPAVGLREQHRHPTAQTRQLISMGMCQFHNQTLALEPAQIIGGLTWGVGYYSKDSNSLHHLTVAETRDEMAE